MTILGQLLQDDDENKKVMPVNPELGTSFLKNTFDLPPELKENAPFNVYSSSIATEYRKQQNWANNLKKANDMGFDINKPENYMLGDSNNLAFSKSLLAYNRILKEKKQSYKEQNRGFWGGVYETGKGLVSPTGNIKAAWYIRSNLKKGFTRPWIYGDAMSKFEKTGDKKYITDTATFFSNDTGEDSLIGGFVTSGASVISNIVKGGYDTFITDNRVRQQAIERLKNNKSIKPVKRGRIEHYTEEQINQEIANEINKDPNLFIDNLANEHKFEFYQSGFKNRYFKQLPHDEQVRRATIYSRIMASLDYAGLMLSLGVAGASLIATPFASLIGFFGSRAAITGAKKLFKSRLSKILLSGGSEMLTELGQESLKSIGNAHAMVYLIAKETGIPPTLADYINADLEKLYKDRSNLGSAAAFGFGLGTFASTPLVVLDSMSEKKQKKQINEQYNHIKKHMVSKEKTDNLFNYQQLVQEQQNNDENINVTFDSIKRVDSEIPDIVYVNPDVIDGGENNVFYQELKQDGEGEITDTDIANIISRFDVADKKIAEARAKGENIAIPTKKYMEVVFTLKSEKIRGKIKKHTSTEIDGYTEQEYNDFQKRLEVTNKAIEQEKLDGQTQYDYIYKKLGDSGFAKAKQEVTKNNHHPLTKTDIEKGHRMYAEMINTMSYFFKDPDQRKVWIDNWFKTHQDLINLQSPTKTVSSKSPKSELQKVIEKSLKKELWKNKDKKTDEPQEVALTDDEKKLWKKRRNEGSYTIDGITYTAPEPIPDDKKVVGDKTNIAFDNENRVEGNFVVVNTNDVITSHTKDGKRNPNNFFPETQPKMDGTDRELQRVQIANNDRVQPDKLIQQNTEPFDGAPIILPDGHVIQGNNRAAGIKLGYESGDYSAYKDYLIENADKFGLDPEQIKGMKNPMLVRVVNVSDKQAIKLGNIADTDTRTGLNTRFDPKNIPNIQEEHIEQFLKDLFLNVPEGKTLNYIVRENESLIYDFIVANYPENQVQGVINDIFRDRHNFKTDGAKYAEYLVLGLVFKNASVENRNYFSDMPDNVIKQGITKSLGIIMSVPQEKNIAGDLMAIMPILSKRVLLDEYMEKAGTKSLLEGDRYTESQHLLLQLLGTARTRQHIKEAFEEYKKLVTDTLLNVGADKEQALKTVIRDENLFKQEVEPGTVVKGISKKQALQSILETQKQKNRVMAQRLERTMQIIQDNGLEYYQQLSEQEIEDRNLLPIHFTTVGGMTRMLDIGGMPMSSIGVNHIDNLNNEFGNVVIIFNKGIIDYENDYVYDNDIFSPRLKNRFDVDTMDEALARQQADIERGGGVVGAEFQGIYTDVNKVVDKDLPKFLASFVASRIRSEQHLKDSEWQLDPNDPNNANISETQSDLDSTILNIARTIDTDSIKPKGDKQFYLPETIQALNGIDPNDRQQVADYLNEHFTHDGLPFDENTEQVKDISELLENLHQYPRPLFEVKKKGEVGFDQVELVAFPNDKKYDKQARILESKGVKVVRYDASGTNESVQSNLRDALKENASNQFFQRREDRGQPRTTKAEWDDFLALRELNSQKRRKKSKERQENYRKIAEKMQARYNLKHELLRADSRNRDIKYRLENYKKNKKRFEQEKEIQKILDNAGIYKKYHEAFRLGFIYDGPQWADHYLSYAKGMSWQNALKKRFGDVFVSKSEKDGQKGVSIYLKDYGLRISNHEVPMTNERQFSGGFTWADKPYYDLSEYNTVDELIADIENDLKGQKMYQQKENASNLMFQEREQGNDLIVTYNTNSTHLEKMLELGGFPVPSLAVRKLSTTDKQFGNIVFIGPNSLVKTNTHAGDIYSDRTPDNETKGKKEGKIFDFNYYSRTGKRRYLEYTLKNLTRLMKNKNYVGAEGGSGVNYTKSFAVKKLKGIRGIQKNRDLIQNDQEKAEKLISEASDLFYSLKKYDWIKVKSPNYYFDLDGWLQEIADFQDPYFLASILNARYTKANGDKFKASDEKIKDIIKLSKLYQSIPTKYFESKPQRAVMFDEFTGVVIPNDKGNDKIAKQLQDMGLIVKRYDHADGFHNAVKELETIATQENLFFQETQPYFSGMFSSLANGLRTNEKLRKVVAVKKEVNGDETVSKNSLIQFLESNKPQEKGFDIKKEEIEISGIVQWLEIDKKNDKRISVKDIVDYLDGKFVNAVQLNLLKKYYPSVEYDAFKADFIANRKPELQSNREELAKQQLSIDEERQAKGLDENLKGYKRYLRQLLIRKTIRRWHREDLENIDDAFIRKTYNEENYKEFVNERYSQYYDRNLDDARELSIKSRYLKNNMYDFFERLKAKYDLQDLDLSSGSTYLHMHYSLDHGGIFLMYASNGFYTGSTNEYEYLEKFKTFIKFIEKKKNIKFSTKDIDSLVNEFNSFLNTEKNNNNLELSNEQKQEIWDNYSAKDKREVKAYADKETTIELDSLWNSGRGAKYERYTNDITDDKKIENYREMIIETPLGRNVEKAHQNKHFRKFKNKLLWWRAYTGLVNGRDTYVVAELQSDQHQNLMSKSKFIKKSDTYRKKEISMMRDYIHNVLNDYGFKVNLYYKNERDKNPSIMITDKNQNDFYIHNDVLETYNTNPVQFEFEHVGVDTKHYNAIRDYIASFKDAPIDQVLNENEIKEIEKEYPNLPFKKDAWIKLGIKQALIDAVNNGYEYIAWTEAKTQSLGKTKMNALVADKMYDKEIPKILQELGITDIERTKPSEWVENEIGEKTEVPQGDWIARIPEKLKNEIQTKGLPMFQKQPQKVADHRGFYNLEERSITLLTEYADVDTIMHEIAHSMLHNIQVTIDSPDIETPPEMQAWYDDVVENFADEKGKAEYAATGKIRNPENNRNMHENFAKGFEDYLYTGKAPTKRLQSLFDSIRKLMVKAWEKIGRTLGFKDGTFLNEEQRAVFDRMLATQQEIEQENARYNIDSDTMVWNAFPDDGSPETEKLKKELETAVQDSKEKANAQIVKESMSQYDQERKSESKKWLADLNDLATKKVLENVPYADVIKLIIGDKNTQAIKLNRDDVIAWLTEAGYSEKQIKNIMIGLNKHGITARQGNQKVQDVLNIVKDKKINEKYGLFGKGEPMIPQVGKMFETISQMPTFPELVRQERNRLIPNNPHVKASNKRLDEIVQDAYDQHSTRIIQLQLELLGKTTKNDSLGGRSIRKASAIIQDMVKKDIENRPANKLPKHKEYHRRAANARKKYLKESQKKNPNYNEIYNLLLTEMYNIEYAKQIADEQLKYNAIKKRISEFTKDEGKKAIIEHKKLFNEKWSNNVFPIVQEIAKRALGISDGKFEVNDEMQFYIGGDLYEYLLDDNLTLGDMKNIDKGLQDLYKKYKLETEQEYEEKSGVIKQLSDKVKGENVSTQGSQVLSKQNETKLLSQIVHEFAVNTRAILEKISPSFSKYVMEQIRKGDEQYAKMLNEIYQPFIKKINSFKLDVKLDMKGWGIGEYAETMPLHTALTILLNLGNESNREQLRKSQTLSEYLNIDSSLEQGQWDAQVFEWAEAVFDSEHWQLAQFIWDTYKKIRVPLNAAYKARNGFDLDIIDGDLKGKNNKLPITITGGYYPIFRDTVGRNEPPKGVEYEGKNDAELYKSFTENRVNSNLKFIFDIKDLEQSVINQIMYASYDSSFFEISRLMRLTGVKESIKKTYGKNGETFVKEIINSAMLPKNSDKRFSALVRFISSVASFIAMGFSLSVGFAQFMAVAQHIPKIITGKVAVTPYFKALLTFTQLKHDVAEISDVMKMRIGSTDNIIVALGQGQNIKIGNADRIIKPIQNASFILPRIIDGFLTNALFMGAYQKGLNKGLSQEQAKIEAENVVKQTSPMPSLSEQSALTKSSARVLGFALGWTTPIISDAYINFLKTRRKGKVDAEFTDGAGVELAAIIGGIAIMGIMESIRQNDLPDFDDPEDVSFWFIRSVLLANLSLVVLVRDSESSVRNMFGADNKVYQPTGAPTIALLQNYKDNVLKGISNAMNGEIDESDLIKMIPLFALQRAIKSLSEQDNWQEILFTQLFPAYGKK